MGEDFAGVILFAAAAGVGVLDDASPVPNIGLIAAPSLAPKPPPKPLLPLLLLLLLPPKPPPKPLLVVEALPKVALGTAPKPDEFGVEVAGLGVEGALGESKVTGAPNPKPAPGELPKVGASVPPPKEKAIVACVSILILVLARIRGFVVRRNENPIWICN